MSIFGRLLIANPDIWNYTLRRYLTPNDQFVFWALHMSSKTVLNRDWSLYRQLGYRRERCHGCGQGNQNYISKDHLFCYSCERKIEKLASERRIILRVKHWWEIADMFVITLSKGKIRTTPKLLSIEKEPTFDSLIEVLSECRRCQNDFFFHVKLIKSYNSKTVHLCYSHHRYIYNLDSFDLIPINEPIFTSSESEDESFEDSDY